MRVLLGYGVYPHPFSITDWYENWLARLRAAGLEIHGFCLTPRPPAERLTWPKLERQWRTGQRDLLAMYQRLYDEASKYDVFVNFNGINLHPDFVRMLPTFNVYGCSDDPESSDDLSKPVATSYDMAMIGNIAEIETYRSWGVKHVGHWPLGFRFDDYDPSLTRDRVLEGNRDIDVALLCERTSDWRRERLDKIAAAFPQGRYHGKGWPAGFLPEKERIPLLQRTKIGPNFHNSTGPINFRTFILPANGILQVCDNKSFLGKLFELNKEAIGFDAPDEAIELCRYYLNHDRERREMAAAGFDRAMRDYNEVACVRRALEEISATRATLAAESRKPEAIRFSSVEQRRRTVIPRIQSIPRQLAAKAYGLALKVLR
jgi:hypothetical protein